MLHELYQCYKVLQYYHYLVDCHWQRNCFREFQHTIFLPCDFILLFQRVKIHKLLNPHLSNTVIFLSIGSLTKTTLPFPDMVSPGICGQLIIIQIKTDLKRQAKMCVPFAPRFKDLNSTSVKSSRT